MTTKTPRIGPSMRFALLMVQTHGPYPSRQHLAKLVGPHGSQKYGYDIVERCIAAGLLKLGPVPPGSRGGGRVELTEAGLAEVHKG